MKQQSIKLVEHKCRLIIGASIMLALNGCQTIYPQSASQTTESTNVGTQTNQIEDAYIIRPQEIYLLERYSSPEYFKEMRDAYANMLIAAEQALDIFIHDLPYDLRGRPLNRQYDIVWGERVLPNLRSTLNGLDRGYQALLNEDLSALGYGGNVSSDFRAMGIDYTIDWMPKKQQEEVGNGDT